MNNQSYLEKYAGRKSRHECPACHDKYSFTYYLNGDTGQVIDKAVGRCDHESGCGYHYTPKEYHRDNPDTKIFPTSSLRAHEKGEITARVKENSGNITVTFNKNSPKATPRVNEQEAGRIPKQYLLQSLGYSSNFVAFLCSIFDRYTIESPTIERLMSDYYLGCTKNGSVIYWQLDTRKRIRTGKIMQYDPATGKRIKKENGTIDWVHAKLKRNDKLPDDFNIVQCLFGEHLLTKHPDKVIALVESEKSALVGAGVYPEYLWLATGGRSQISIDKLQVLRGRIIIMFPDTDADGKTYALWREKAKELEGMGCKVMVSDLLEKAATFEDRESGLDIADYLICQLKAAIVEPEPVKVLQPLTREELALQRLGDLNPNIHMLIDTLRLQLQPPY